MKFNQWKVEQLKKELGQRNLSITGVKAELQVRLRNSMEAEEINLENHPQAAMTINQS